MTENAVRPDSSESCEYRVIVCGGRAYHGRDFIYEILDQLRNDCSWTEKSLKIIQGGATGADTYAKLWAILRNIPYVEYPAEWDKFGFAAGAVRNVKMLQNEKPHLVIAFPGGNGTDNMVKVAKANGTSVKDLRNG